MPNHLLFSVSGRCSVWGGDSGGAAPPADAITLDEVTKGVAAAGGSRSDTFMSAFSSLTVNFTGNHKRHSFRSNFYH